MPNPILIFVNILHFAKKLLLNAKRSLTLLKILNSKNVISAKNIFSSAHRYNNNEQLQNEIKTETHVDDTLICFLYVLRGRKHQQTGLTLVLVLGLEVLHPLLRQVTLLVPLSRVPPTHAATD